MFKSSLILGLSLVCQSIFGLGTNYFVAKNGSDSNTGLTNSPFLTIGKAKTIAGGGDNVYISLGIYNEAVTWTNGGSSSAQMLNVIGNFWNVTNGAWAQNSGATIRSFKISSTSNIRFIGFVETHSDTTYGANPNAMTGTYSNILWFDSIFTNIYAGDSGAAFYFANSPSYCVVRGCVVWGVNTTVGGQHNAYGFASDFLNSHHMVIEYNKIRRVDDFISIYGQTNLYRNNDMGDHLDTYWTSSSGHADGFQVGSDGADVGAKHIMIERNIMLTNQCLGMAEGAKNGHFLIDQDQTGGGGTFGDTNTVMRGNVVHRVNDGALLVIGVDHVICYNNSLNDLNTTGAGYTPIAFFRFASVNGIFQNTLFGGPYPAPNTLAIEVLDGSSILTSHNGGTNGGGHSSFISSNDVLYVSTSTGDFHLQNSSPYKGQATNIIWITSADSSGTSFVVNDSQRLYDGRGMVEGDVITTGGTQTRITSIAWNTHTVTVANSVSWTNGQPVYWGELGTQKDMGALPYGAVNLTSGVITHSGTTYTVVTTGDARGIWFYTNGIPAVWDVDSPYQQTLTGVVTAKGYANWAQVNPAVDILDGGDSGPVSGNSSGKNSGLRSIRVRP